MSRSPDEETVTALDEMLKKLRTLSRSDELSSALRQFLVKLADQFSHMLAGFRRTRE